ncbi:unnamed protein product [Ranitomeya imitator]|uniref:Protein kinase domain-containing protein n=1 Tax=Ranitomeya imitator TaxID=111125 RepID=A0ABN9L647_9NEOB|nr:unnamed protein product [Ranitomeya imitator]
MIVLGKKFDAMEAFCLFPKVQYTPLQLALLSVWDKRTVFLAGPFFSHQGEAIPALVDTIRLSPTGKSFSLSSGRSITSASLLGWGSSPSFTTQCGVAGTSKMPFPINLLDIRAICLALRHWQSPPRRPAGPHTIGQRHCSGLHKQSRRDSQQTGSTYLFIERLLELNPLVDMANPQKRLSVLWGKGRLAESCSVWTTGASASGCLTGSTFMDTCAFPFSSWASALSISSRKTTTFRTRFVKCGTWLSKCAKTFFHDNKLTHTDLKPENILFVNSDFELTHNMEKVGARLSGSCAQ